MKAAIYARYSSDKQSDASIEDQVRKCRTYAKREGWKVCTVYADRALSGSKANRPEYLKMLADVDEKAFDVLLMEDLSRLSRNNVEQGRALELLNFEGIRVIGLSDGYDNASESHEIVSGVRGITNSIYLKDLKAKTHRGLMGKALNGQNTGGRAYGYQHVPIEHPHDKDAYGRPKIIGVKRKVDPEQAKIVRQIFKWFSEGRGYREIAVMLNKAGVPASRSKTWSASSIRPMLQNSTYAGQVVWIKREWRRSPKTGKRQPKRRDASEWVTTDTPALRIIPDKLWKSVQARRDDLLKTHQKRQARGKARPGKTPTYLFSGIVKCNTCGGNYIKANRTHYVCSAYSHSGEKACNNSVSVRRDVLEQKLLHTIKTELFDDASFKKFKAEAKRILNQRMKERSKDTSAQRRALAKVEREIGNMVSFVKAGTIPATLADEMRKAEAEREKLQAELATEIPTIANVENVLTDVLDRYAVMSFNLEDFAQRDITKARNMIKALVGGRIMLRPTKGGGLDAELQGDYAGLIQLVAGTQERSKARMVAGARNHLNLLFDAPHLA